MYFFRVLGDIIHLIFIEILFYIVSPDVTTMVEIFGRLLNPTHTATNIAIVRLPVKVFQVGIYEFFLLFFITRIGGLTEFILA